MKILGHTGSQYFKILTFKTAHCLDVENRVWTIPFL